MSTGPMFGVGMQMLQDSQLRWKNTTTPVYLRLKNFEPPTGQQWAMLGFSISPSGSVGTTDVLIDPPPTMNTMSLHNIGILAGKLRFGAKSFLISSTFVNAQQAALGLTDPKLVFTLCVGLVNENMLYSIEDIQHETVAGQIINWQLICNANELR